ncbi:hydrogenase maturation protease [Demequina mangrovi]|uniref:Hydrogenase maturation protease n=1 Tax=Demequina mangrovi TaxID=1043493 RepID=A0A1H6ZND7_9MICO|nr:hydrogenase maturation protease [Demequina mangrovi]SEJ51222.1 hydrogenase maturation protease [Demequina mangrovi]
MTADRVLVVGLGSPDRGDDAVGAAVAERLAAMDLDHVDVVTREDPTQLVQLWAGHGAALVIDAVMSGNAPGRLHIREVGDAGEPLPTHAFTAAGRGGSHAFGLAGAVELARTLGTLPTHVTVVGVEAKTFDFGPMSPEIQEALDAAVATAAAELIALKEEVTPCV